MELPETGWDPGRPTRLRVYPAGRFPRSAGILGFHLHKRLIAPIGVAGFLLSLGFMLSYIGENALVKGPALLGGNLQRAAWLTSLDYPGNVRELRNIIERTTILFPGQQVQVADIIPLGDVLHPSSTARSSLPEQLATYERALIEQTLAGCDSNISEAARQLGIDRANLSKKIKEFSSQSK